MNKTYNFSAGPAVLPKEVLQEAANEMLNYYHLAEKVGIVNLRGHRSIDGMRASLYNTMPLDNVQYLIDFMEHFEKRYK